jgi:2-polyprenyl-6-methoxyphenol hydroxylase-like FAD-dependent oxidoreductase
MSPVGGQGINIALRDAIVAANKLVPVLSQSALSVAGLSAALDAIEAERMPEVRQVQALQAQPPKVILSRAWWGEPVRRVVGGLMSRPAVRHRAAARVSAFFYGVTDVRLAV